MTEIQFGLSFSHRRAAQFGFDPHEAFYALLIHLKPRHLRLSLYWDEIAPHPGAYAFNETRWYLDRAQEHDCRVLLTTGYKPQRHPDVAAPSWLRGNAGSATGEGPGHERLSAVLLMALERTVALLADYDVIDSWQVENEPFLPARDQPTGWSMPPSLILREAEVLREVDPRYRPVVIDAGGRGKINRGWWTALTAADVLGWNLPPPRGSGSPARLLAWQLRAQALLASRLQKPCWITELPVEPPPQTRGAPRAGHSATMLQPRTFPSLLAFARSSGATRAYLLGVEWWLLRRNQGDPAWWEAARTLLREAADATP